MNQHLGRDGKGRFFSTLPKISREELTRLYHQEMKSLGEIAKRYGVSKFTLFLLMKKFGIPTRSRGEGTRLVRQHPLDLSNRDLPYVLGVIFGDGCCYGKIRRGCYTGTIRLRQTRKEFGDSFAKALRNLGLKPRIWKIPPKSGGIIQGRKIEGKKPQYVVQAYSKSFVEWFKGASLDEMKTIIFKNKEGLRGFIRGFYESEGTNYFDGDHRWTIRIYNTDARLIELTKEALDELGFDFQLRSCERSHWLYSLISSSKDQNRRFIDEVKPCIKNKIPPLSSAFRGR